MLPFAAFCGRFGRAARRCIDERPRRERLLLGRAGLVAAALLLGSFALPAFDGYVEHARVAGAGSDSGALSLQLYRWQEDNSELPEGLAEARLGGVDPWGPTLIYLCAAGTSRAPLRKDAGLEPLNTDFDLYGLEPDGESALALDAAASPDDVVHAKHGNYIGLGANY